MRSSAPGCLQATPLLRQGWTRLGAHILSQGWLRQHESSAPWHRAPPAGRPRKRACSTVLACSAERHQGTYKHDSGYLKLCAHCLLDRPTGTGVAEQGRAAPASRAQAVWGVRVAVRLGYVQAREALCGHYVLVASLHQATGSAWAGCCGQRTHSDVPVRKHHSPLRNAHMGVCCSCA